MSLKITVEISIADDKAYTEREAAIIAAMQSHPAGTGRAKVEEAAAPAALAKPAPAAPAKSAPKAAPAKPSTTRAAVLEDTPEPEVEEVEEVEEDLLGGEEEAPQYTLADAVSAATKRVSSGKAADVKAALAGTGAKKVSELEGDDIVAFMQALGA